MVEPATTPAVVAAGAATLHAGPIPPRAPMTARVVEATFDAASGLHRVGVAPRQGTPGHGDRRMSRSSRRFQITAPVGGGALAPRGGHGDRGATPRIGPTPD
jgi:hypothetical protein